MAKHLDRYQPRVTPHEFRVDGRVLDCLVGLPPDLGEVSTNVVQLNTGLASGPSMFEEYGRGLNRLGHPTVIVSPRHPNVHSHQDVMRVSEALLAEEFEFEDDIQVELLSYATHSLGTYNTIVGLAEHDDAALIAMINNIVEIDPVGYGGVQHVWGALRTVTGDIVHTPKSKKVRAMAIEAFLYGIRANTDLGALIRVCRECDLRDMTYDLIQKGIGIGAVLHAGDHMVHAAESEVGLRQAGVEVIEVISGDHNDVLFETENTLRAGLRVRDGLDAKRAERELRKSA